MGVLTGKTALVTGASRGIGKEIALRLARDGAFVIVHYGASADAARGVVAQIGHDGGTAFAAGADLADLATIEPLFATIDAELAQRGLGGIDILINNAGIGMMANLLTVTPEQFDRVFAVNTRAPLFVAQAAAARMGAGGRIINITSVVGSKAFGGNFVAYGATKAALNYMTVAMAATLGPRGITVNAIAPGATNTDFVGDMMSNAAVVARLKADSALGEVGDPRDVASAVALLASPDARWITGEVVHATGGTLL